MSHFTISAPLQPLALEHLPGDFNQVCEVFRVEIGNGPLSEKRQEAHAEQEVGQYRGEGGAYLTALTGDHPVVDP